MEKIIKINRNQYKLMSDRELSKLEMDDVISKIKTNSCCGKKNTLNNSSIHSLVPICSESSAMIGETIHLSATPQGGTPNYVVKFYKGTTLLYTFSDIPEGTEVSYDYQLVNSDAPETVFGVLIDDSCVSGGCQEACNVLVQECPALTCSVVCNKTSAIVGEEVEMSITPRGGISPYIIKVYKDTTLLYTFSDIPEGYTEHYSYQLVSNDVPEIILGAVFQDSCASGSQRCEDSCNVTVICPVTVCNFRLNKA